MTRGHKAKALVGTRLRKLIGAVLRVVLKGRAPKREFRLRDASFGGRGLQREFATGEWEKLVAAAYDKRGED